MVIKTDCLIFYYFTLTLLHATKLGEGLVVAQGLRSMLYTHVQCANDSNRFHFKSCMKLNVCVCISRVHAVLMSAHASCPVDFGSRNIWEANFALHDACIRTAVCFCARQTD